MADPSYGKIMDFLNYLKSIGFPNIGEYYKIIKDVNFDEFDKDYIQTKNNMYNYSICCYFRQYIRFLSEYKDYYYYDELKKYEQKFIELFYEIMTNNYKNIKYSFTFSIISSYTILASYSLVKYLNITKYKNIELIYLLERINPSELPCFSCSGIAEFIYSKLTDLRLMWMGAIVKGTAVFALMTHCIKYNTL